MKLHPALSALMFGLVVFGLNVVMDMKRGTAVDWTYAAAAGTIIFLMDLLMSSKRS